MEFGSAGVSEFGGSGVSECWSVGALVYWCVGVEELFYFRVAMKIKHDY